MGNKQKYRKAKRHLTFNEKKTILDKLGLNPTKLRIQTTSVEYDIKSQTIQNWIYKGIQKNSKKNKQKDQSNGMQQKIYQNKQQNKQQNQIQVYKECKKTDFSTNTNLNNNQKYENSLSKSPKREEEIQQMMDYELVIEI